MKNRPLSIVILSIAHIIEPLFKLIYLKLFTGFSLYKIVINVLAIDDLKAIFETTAREWSVDFFSYGVIEDAKAYKAMQKAGIDPALIHAYEETSLLLTENNDRFVSQSDVAQWDAAIGKYEKKTGTKATHRRLSEDDVERILSQISP